MGTKSEEFLELINTRRSVRVYEEKTVSREVLDKIVEAGLRAPSSKNSQPWYVVVLQDKEKDKICDWVEESEGKVPWDVPELLGGQKTESPYDSVKASLKFIKEASALILIFNRGPFTGGSKNKGKDFDRDVMLPNEMVGVGACMENMLLATHALGLGGVALMDIWPAAQKVKEVYNIEYDFVVGIAIGYPKIFPGKRPLQTEDFVRFI